MRPPVGLNVIGGGPVGVVAAGDRAFEEADARDDSPPPDLGGLHIFLDNAIIRSLFVGIAFICASVHPSFLRLDFRLIRVLKLLLILFHVWTFIVALIGLFQVDPNAPRY